MSRFAIQPRAASSETEVPERALEEKVEAPVQAEAPEPAPEPAEEPKSAPSNELLESKLQIHNKLIDELDLSGLDKMTPEELRTQIGVFVTKAIADQRLPMGAAEVKEFTDDIVNEMVGLGPLEPLLADESISDILINGHNQVYVERGGELELSNARFRDNLHLRRIINKIVSAVGRRVDEGSPRVDARLAFQGRRARRPEEQRQGPR